MIWTADADTLLLRLCEKGGSMKSVANEMGLEGYCITRNMIAGRKHRLRQKGVVIPKLVSGPKPTPPPKLKLFSMARRRPTPGARQ